MLDHSSPIIAIATAPGRGAVGIVRVSGKHLEPLIQAVCGQALTPRHATYLKFLGSDGSAIDHGLAIYFPAPHSFTGEDVLELQAHGGAVVLQMLLARCLGASAENNAQQFAAILPGLRIARAGEFTQRAFLNNKIDLLQAEAIADLIDASTETAARGAVRSLSGAFSQEIATMRGALIKLRMLVEATLDFPEEEVDSVHRDDALRQLAALRSQLSTVLAITRQGVLLRDGVRVVIAGQPNAGKSSLLNALAGVERAIVTPVAGTTRDIVEQALQIEGVPLHLVDTAGLRDSDDVVERVGIERAWAQTGIADLVIFLHDLSRSNDADYAQEEAKIRGRLSRDMSRGVPLLDVWNKSDVAPHQVAHGGLALSAKTGQGLDAVRAAILDAAGWQPSAEGAYIARERHIQALQAMGKHLAQAAQHFGYEVQLIDLAAEELRLAQCSLDEITGAFSSDDLLGEIFTRFCIGK